MLIGSLKCLTKKVTIFSSSDLGLHVFAREKFVMLSISGKSKNRLFTISNYFEPMSKSNNIVIPNSIFLNDLEGSDGTNIKSFCSPI